MTAETNLERARFNMIEQQIRTWDVLDPRVLNLLFEVRREEFISAQYRPLAFVDMEIPLAPDAKVGQTMLAPKLEARMLQALAIQSSDRILEIGTGSGYLTALLAKSGAHVCSIEIVPEFSATAKARLEAHDILNTTLEIGDGARGWPKHLPYDVIVLTASLPVLPASFQESLAVGGRLLVTVGEAPVMEVRLITCAAPGAYSTVALFETCIAPFQNALQPERFVF
jgi:protein-L-isoaspartate(D-aspartate) O-methyltransferase